MNSSTTEKVLEKALWGRVSPHDISQPVEVSHPPKVAWLALSSRCNLTCRHCIRYRNKIEKIETTEGDMTDTLFGRLDRELFGNLDACIVGGNNHGEQLLSKWWVPFIEKLSKKDCLIELISNCTMLTEERAEEIVSNNINLRCSIEGATPSTYEKIRGFSFEKFMNNLKLLSKLIQENPGSKTDVVFNFTIFESNVRELPLLIEICASLDFTGISVIHLFPRNQFQRYQSMTFHRSLYSEIYEKSMKLAGEKGIALFMQKPFSSGSIFESPPEKEKNFEQSKTLFCPLPWMAVSIDSDGKVYPCCSSRMEMGDLNRQSMEEIWNGRVYRRLRKGMLTMKLPRACRDCQWVRWGLLTTNHEPDVLSSIGGAGEASVHEAAKIFALSILPKIPFGQKLRKLLRYYYFRS